MYYLFTSYDKIDKIAKAFIIEGKNNEKICEILFNEKIIPYNYFDLFFDNIDYTLSSGLKIQMILIYEKKDNIIKKGELIENVENYNIDFYKNFKDFFIKNLKPDKAYISLQKLKRYINSLTSIDDIQIKYYLNKTKHIFQHSNNEQINPVISKFVHNKLFDKNLIKLIKNYE